MSQHNQPRPGQNWGYFQVVQVAMLAYLILVFVLGTLGYQSFERTVLYMLLVIGAAAITAAGE